MRANAPCNEQGALNEHKYTNFHLLPLGIFFYPLPEGPYARTKMHGHGFFS